MLEAESNKSVLGIGFTLFLAQNSIKPPALSCIKTEKKWICKNVKH